MIRPGKRVGIENGKEVMKPLDHEGPECTQKKAIDLLGLVE